MKRSGRTGSSRRCASRVPDHHDTREGTSAISVARVNEWSRPENMRPCRPAASVVPARAERARRKDQGSTPERGVTDGPGTDGVQKRCDDYESGIPAL